MKPDRPDSVPLLSITPSTGAIARWVKRWQPTKGDLAGQWPRLIETRQWGIPAEDRTLLGAEGFLEILRVKAVV